VTQLLAPKPPPTPAARAVSEGLERLAPVDRALVELAVRHGMSDAEIGESVGLDAESVSELRLGVLEGLTTDLAEAGLGGSETLVAALKELEEAWALPEHVREEPAPTPPAPPVEPAELVEPAVPGRRRRWPQLLGAAAVAAGLAVVLALVLGGSNKTQRGESTVGSSRPAEPLPALPTAAPERVGTRHDVYAADRPNKLSPVVRHFPQRVYVPNSQSDTVDEIDPHTYKVVRHFRVGALPQHVVPSYDLKTLWVNNNKGNTLTPINPKTGGRGKPVRVTDPYNLYFTPDGRSAIVMAEALQRIDFRDPHTMRLRRKVPLRGCPGVNHADFTANGSTMLASCEFAGRMIVVDLAHERVIRTLRLRVGAMPQDVKLSPDGRVFYVADMATNGLWVIGAKRFRKLGFIPTGRGAHGLYVSRDSRYLYVSNRAEGSISVLSFKKRRVVKKWQIPGGGSPDMGGVSSNGRVLWLSGRYNSEVYAISTRTGRLIARIPVGAGPHGLCIYPQPGRYSLGHTGVFR